MIRLEQVLIFHTRLIEIFGGTEGIRSLELLKSALARPFQTFDGEDLYNTPFQKAAAIAESITGNHPFVDGNKRMGYVLMRLLLNQYDLDVVSSEDEKYEVMIQLAEGKLSLDELFIWLEKNSVKK